MGQTLVIAQPIGAITIPANTVVASSIHPIYDWDQLPGRTVAVRLTANVSAAGSPGLVKVCPRILTPSTGADVLIDKESIILPGLGFQEGNTAVFAKPVGLQRLDATLEMTEAGTAGALDTLTMLVKFNDPAMAAMWNLWLPSTSLLNYGGSGPGDESQGNNPGLTDVGNVAVFDFSLIPKGATVKVVVAGQSRDSNCTFKLRACNLVDYQNITGDVLLTGFYTDAGGSGQPFSAHASFINNYTTPKLLKFTGYRTGGSSGQGVAGSVSLVMMY